MGQGHRVEAAVVYCPPVGSFLRTGTRGLAQALKLSSWFFKSRLSGRKFCLSSLVPGCRQIVICYPLHEIYLSLSLSLSIFLFLPLSLSPVFSLSNLLHSLSLTPFLSFPLPLSLTRCQIQFRTLYTCYCKYLKYTSLSLSLSILFSLYLSLPFSLFPTSLTQKKSLNEPIYLYCNCTLQQFSI